MVGCVARRGLFLLARVRHATIEIALGWELAQDIERGVVDGILGDRPGIDRFALSCAVTGLHIVGQSRRVVPDHRIGIERDSGRVGAKHCGHVRAGRYTCNVAPFDRTEVAGCSACHVG